MRTNNPFVYADHAATTPLLPEALEAMLPWLKGGFGNPSSLHSFGRAARKAVEDARATIAECLHAEPKEIFFTSGGTEANNWAIKGTTGGLLVSAYEHHSILNAAESERRKGRKVAFAKPTKRGQVGLRQLTASWFDRVGLVSVMAANNEIGAVNRIGELCAKAHQDGALFHTDAVQAVGKIRIDVREWGVDFLSASAHKFGGPKGVGFLYAADGRAPTRLLDGGGQERDARAGTENVAGIVGMAAALKTCRERQMDSSIALLMSANLLREAISGIFPTAVFQGPEKPRDRIPGFVSVTIPEHPAEGMLHVFDLKGIAVSAGAACNSKETKVSHVLKAIGLSDEAARCTLRISLGPSNTVEDIERILAVFRIIKKTGTGSPARKP